MLGNYTGSLLTFCAECVYIQQGFREHELVIYLSFSLMNNQRPTFLLHLTRLPMTV